MSIQQTTASLPFQQAISTAASDGHISGKELKQLKSMLKQEQLSEPERAALSQILDKAGESSQGFLFFRGSIDAKELSQLKQLAAKSPGSTGAQLVTGLETALAAKASGKFTPVSAGASFPDRASARRDGGAKAGETVTGKRLADASRNILANPHMQDYLKRKGVKPMLDDKGQLINYRKPDGKEMSYCAAGVENTLKQVYGGKFRLEGHAYQMGDQMAAKKFPDGQPMFKEIPGLKPPYNWNQAQALMKSLPAGAVVVWDKPGGDSPGGQYGHIAIALGDGRESSDRIRDQFSVLGGNCRIFLPRDLEAKPQ